MARTETIDRAVARLRLLCHDTNKHGEAEADALLALFYEDWADLDDDLLTIAVEQYTGAADRPFFPTPGQIRILAYKLITIATPDGATAWATLKAAMRRTHLDIDPIPTFDDPLMRRAIDAIGWRNLMMQTMEDEIGNRAHFIRVYDALRAQRETIAVMKVDTLKKLIKTRQRLGAALTVLSDPAERKRLTGGQPPKGKGRDETR